MYTILSYTRAVVYGYVGFGTRLLYPPFFVVFFFYSLLLLIQVLFPKKRKKVVYDYPHFFVLHFFELGSNLLVERLLNDSSFLFDV